MIRHVPNDHYAALGVERDASPTSIKQAYRTAAKRFHPDRDPSIQATSAFIAVKRAYDVLGDPLLRIAYDRQLRPVHRDPRYRPAPAKERERAAHRMNSRTDMRTRSWAFLGLHLTGLLFGAVIVIGLVVGILVRDWPWPAIFFALPGSLIMPDAWEGVRMWNRKGHRAHDALS